MKNLMKGFTAKMIKGEPAVGAYSHTKNKVKYFVVSYKLQLYYGTDLETIFNSL